MISEARLSRAFLCYENQLTRKDGPCKVDLRLVGQSLFGKKCLVLWYKGAF